MTLCNQLLGVQDTTNIVSLGYEKVGGNF
jgi:hypothetical protein